jgi:hypothetical protein
LRVKAGKLEAYRQLQRDVARQLQAEKPRTLVFLIYLNQNGTQMTAVHVFADAESMDLHFQGSEERSRTAYEFLEPEGWEIYGTPSHTALETMRQAAASSRVTLTLQTEHVAGFLRPTPE